MVYCAQPRVRCGGGGFGGENSKDQVCEVRRGDADGLP
jgi:hypothetical protein